MMSGTSTRERKNCSFLTLQDATRTASVGASRLHLDGMCQQPEDGCDGTLEFALVDCIFHMPPLPKVNGSPVGQVSCQLSTRWSRQNLFYIEFPTGIPL